MKPTLFARALALALPAVLLLAVPATFAGERTVTLDVPGMTCAACPYIVKKSLTRVDGVKAVDVSFSRKEAQVTFDDAETDVAELVAATTENGFPSEVRK